jgi:CubicO group peptidase (beta-lactamase class C family)
MEVRSVKFGTGIPAVLLLALSAACITEPALKRGSGFEPVARDDGWITASPAEVGLDLAAVRRVYDRFYSDRGMFNAISLLIVRDGKLVAEGYARTDRDRDRTRNIQSMTKSVTSMTFGVLHDDGVFPSLDEKLSAVLPAGSFTGDPRTRDITLRHLLTMTSGLSIDNHSFAIDLLMRRPRGQDRFILARPLHADPGARYDYRDADPQLISQAVTARTGRTLASLAEERLFRPLGITDFHWESNVDGVSLGAHALWLAPRDLAKLGLLMLNQGVWNGQRLISPEWIALSTSRQMPDFVSDDGFHVGFYWWLVPQLGAYSAWGHGGQHIFVWPAERLVLVLTALQNTDDIKLGNGLGPFVSLVRELIPNRTCC